METPRPIRELIAHVAGCHAVQKMRGMEHRHTAIASDVWKDRQQLLLDTTKEMRRELLKRWRATPDRAKPEFEERMEDFIRDFITETVLLSITKGMQECPVPSTDSFVSSLAHG